MDSTRIAIML